MTKRKTTKPKTDFRPDTPIAFSGDPLNYAEGKRDPETLQAYLGQTNARAILFHSGKIGIGDGGRPHRVHPSELIGHNLYNPGPIFLGLDGKRPIFAASLANPEEFLPEENFVELRGLGGHLPPADLAMVGRAKSLFDWHVSHRFCVSCGTATNSLEGGIKQSCPSCQTESFPRVNPVVIMLVTHGDRILLGRSPGWPEGFVSALAGFVSPGETPEEAAMREVEEEAGIKTKNPTYMFSQPWPYPSQLMIGIRLEAINTDITLDTKELEFAAWYSREDVKAVFEKRGDAFIRPPRIAIAHQIMRQWLGEAD